MRLNQLLASYPLGLAYITPMVVFMLLTQVETSLEPAYYPWVYLVKVVVVTITLIVFSKPLNDIQPTSRFLVPAIAVGLAVFIEWILLDQRIPYPHLGSRTGFNPWQEIQHPALQFLFIAVRFYGLVVMVPVMEELFWRSFLLRYLSASNWKTLAIGSFSWKAFFLVAIAFGLAHSEWLVAIICACAYALLLQRTKNLFSCILAHSVTNLALGLYVIFTQQWRYW